MKKILSLIAGLGLALLLSANVSADTAGIDVSAQKQGTELVVTVTADGSLGGVVVDLEFDANELYCDLDTITMPENTDYVLYECSVEEGVVSIGFMALNPRFVPNGTVATITFYVADEAQGKAASEFVFETTTVDVVTLNELRVLTGIDVPVTDIPGELNKEEIADRVDEIEGIIEESDGDVPVEITIDMEKENGDVATVVPVEFLEAIQGKNVVLTLSMGEYTWSINGKDLGDGELEAIDLEVLFDEDDENVKFTIPFEGEFGFVATLGLNLGKTNAGQYGNLYVYENGEKVLLSSVLIDENGDVAFEITEGAEYVVVVGEDASNPEDDTDEPNDEDNKDEEDKDTTTDTEPDEKKVPWGLILGIVAVVVVVAGIGIFVFLKRKK